MEYDEFLKSKIKLAPQSGFEIDLEEINPALKPHTRAMVQWAARGGRRAVFAAFGLHKTVTALEWFRQIGIHRPGLRLNVCPLGVRHEFILQAAEHFKNDYAIDVRFIRTDAEIHDERTIYLTNYESVREGKIDVSKFRASNLDEASCLRSYGSKTFQEFMPMFAPVEYRLVSTATPSPNRYKELIHYAAFLGIMDSGQALTRFFQRDSTQANNLTLYPHKEEEFWLWVSSWALFIQKPSDLGFSDEGYDLPALDVRYHEVPSDYSKAGADRDGQGLLIQDMALGITQASKEKRDSLKTRVATMMGIIDGYLGRAQSVPESILRTEQGGASDKTEGPQPNQLPSEDRVIYGAVEAVAHREPGSDEGAAIQQQGIEQRSVNKTQQGLVYGEQAESISAVTKTEACQLRTDSRGISGSARATGREMRDLPSNTGVREQESSTVCGSLSFDGQGAGVALSSLQCGARDAEGQPGIVGEGNRISDQIIIWCDLNDEQDAIEAALKKAGLSYSSIYGSLTTEECESRLYDWLERKTYALIGKPVMIGSGLNLQQCNKAVFLGVTYKFNDLIQSVHRIQRFGQTRQCAIHIIHTEAEREVLRSLQTKWRNHEVMVERMSQLIRKFGLNQLAMHDQLTRATGIERVEVSGEHFTVANNDCVLEARLQPENHLDLIITSIPFANHYEYTPSYNDFGHTENNDHFWKQMDFLTPELKRALKPGRMYCCHVKDRINFGNVTGAGAPTVSPFHMEATMHALKHGFDYMGMITVITDVVRENNQTYRLGWSEQCKDGTKMGVGSPEYILLFRKPQSDRSRGYADIPVTKDKPLMEDVDGRRIEWDKSKRTLPAVPGTGYSRGRWQVDAHSFWRSSGNRLLTAEEMASYGPAKLAKMFTDYSMENIYNYEFHVKIGEELDYKGALPSTFMSLAPGSHHSDVWHDVNRMLTLNGEQSKRNVEQHVCPLQTDIIKRLVNRYSNPGELVYDPFCGLGSVPYIAIKAGRRGGGSELNAQYFADQVHYLKLAEREMSIPDLFAFEEIEAAA